MRYMKAKELGWKEAQKRFKIMISKNTKGIEWQSKVKC